jgi:hypothetical protein
LLCARSGLAKVGVIAIDGTKVHANASRDANVDYEQLAREIIEEAKAVDAAEDELCGDARGDELPEELQTGRGRRQWLREAKRRLERERDEQPQPVPRSRPKRIKEAKRRLEEELFTEVRANEAYEAYRARDRMRNGRRLGAHSKPNPYTPPAVPEGRINTTDPDSHVVKGLRGFIQGYNAQAVCNEHQIVIAAEVKTAGGDFGHLEPMLDATRRELENIGVAETPGVVLADAGYWHQRQMERAIASGSQVLIPPDTGKRKTPRPGWTGGYYDFMRRVLAGERGGELYGRRQPMIEPVFGQTKHNRGMARFHRRGRQNRMAAHHRDPQPAQASPTRPGDRLTAVAALTARPPGGALLFTLGDAHSTQRTSATASGRSGRVGHRTRHGGRAERSGAARAGATRAPAVGLDVHVASGCSLRSSRACSSAARLAHSSSSYARSGPDHLPSRKPPQTWL